MLIHGIEVFLDINQERLLFILELFNYFLEM